MKIRSRVRYTLTNRNGNVFDAELVNGFESLADGEKIYFALSDASGNYAEVEGRISSGGTKFTREELWETDNPNGYDLPNFDATVNAMSGYPAFLTERSYGESALVALGDETLVGFTNGGFDGEKDLTDPDILQTRYNWRDSGDSLTTVNDVVVAGYPLYHGRQYAVANSISPLNAMASVLKRKLGFRYPRIIPATEGGVAFSSFEQGGANYNRLLTMLTDFLGGAGNHIACFVVSVGRLEGKASITQSAMETRLDALRTNLVADVLSSATVDISTVPFIYVDFPDNFMTNFAAAADAQTAIQETPTRQARSAVISGAGLSTTGTEDFDAEGSRGLAERLENAFLAAYKPAPIAQVINVGTVTGSGAAQSVGADAGGGVTVNVGTVTGSGSAQTVTPSVAAGSSWPAIDALAPTHHFRSDVGLNTGTGADFASWENQGSGTDITVASYGTPQVDANGVNFDGNDTIVMPHDGLFNNSAGSSFVMKFLSNNAGHIFNGPESFINTLNNNISWQNPLSGPNLEVLDTAMGDNTEHVLAVTISAGGNMKVYIDGFLDVDKSGISIDTGTTDHSIGSVANGTYGITGYVKAIVAKPGVEWSATDIANITAALP